MQAKWLWKILTNPALEVVATIVVVLIATWFLVSYEAFQTGSATLPVLGK
jgi:hypothetical protein